MIQCSVMISNTCTCTHWGPLQTLILPDPSVLEKTNGEELKYYQEKLGNNEILSVKFSKRSKQTSFSCKNV